MSIKPSTFLKAPSLLLARACPRCSIVRYMSATYVSVKLLLVPVNAVIAPVNSALLSP